MTTSLPVMEFVQLHQIELLRRHRRHQRHQRHTISITTTGRLIRLGIECIGQRKQDSERSALLGNLPFTCESQFQDLKIPHLNLPVSKKGAKVDHAHCCHKAEKKKKKGKGEAQAQRARRRPTQKKKPSRDKTGQDRTGFDLAWFDFARQDRTRPHRIEYDWTSHPGPQELQDPISNFILNHCCNSQSRVTVK